MTCHNSDLPCTQSPEPGSCFIPYTRTGRVLELIRITRDCLAGRMSREDWGSRHRQLTAVDPELPLGIGAPTEAGR